jgi:hypothetical protein
VAPLVLEADYPDVRRLIDPDLTEIDLPDAVLEGPFYLQAAEAEIARLLPGSTSDAAKRAAALLTASYLAPMFPLPQRAQLEDFSFTLPLPSITGIAEALRLRAMAEVNIERSLTADARPRLFAVWRQNRYGGQ